MTTPAKWSTAEDYYLNAFSEKLTLTKLADDLDKTVYAVKKRIGELGVEQKTNTRLSTPNARFHSGFREDLGVKVRSGWEASVLRWLNHMGIEWEYEPKRFYFDYKRGARSYMPDIYLPNYEGTDHWLEVKGRLPPSDKTKLRRFRKHYPDEFAKLMVIPPAKNSEAAAFCRDMNIPIMAYFNELKKEYRDLIPTWED